MHHTHARIIALTAAFWLAGPAAHAAPVAIVQWNSQYVSSNTVRVWADVTISGEPRFSGFAGSVFDVVGDDTLSQSIDHDEGQGLGRRFRFAGTSPGTAADDDILAVDQFQLPFLLDQGHDGSAVLLDFFVFEYRVTDFTPRSVTYASQHLNFAIYIDQSGTNIPCEVQVFDTTFDVTSHVVPLPGPCAMAGAGLVLLQLRRRAR